MRSTSKEKDEERKEGQRNRETVKREKRGRESGGLFNLAPLKEHHLLGRTE